MLMDNYYIHFWGTQMKLYKFKNNHHIFYLIKIYKNVDKSPRIWF
jgi:hypothetical protein